MTEPPQAGSYTFLNGLMPFEILNRAFVFLRCCLAVERAEIFSFARSRIFLAGIQPILPRFQFSNHNDSVGGLVTAKQVLPSLDAQRSEYLATSNLDDRRPEREVVLKLF